MRWPIRIAAVLDTAQVSGPGRQLAALAVRLGAEGVNLRIVTFHRTGHARSPYLDYLESAGVSYEVIRDDGPWDARLIPRLRSSLADWTPHIVQTHGYKPTALAFALRSAGARWPWVAFSHGATAENRKVEFYNWLERRLLGGADRIVVMSREQGESLSRLGDKVRVLHNAAIPLPEDGTGARETAAWALDRTRTGTTRQPVVGVVGRLSPEKGVDVFLRAAHLLVQRGVAFSAVVAGDGPERQKLELLRNALDLGGHVRFIGAVTAVQALYRHLDLLVIPSRSEGLPNVLLEALRADVPVVATRVGAIPEVLEGTRAGMMISPGDPRALADAIAHGLSLKEDAVSREARRAVTEHFSPERRVHAHLELYDDVLGARRQQTRIAS
jgi:glycosyltransferase involved in cell wall biosynthesis